MTGYLGEKGKTRTIREKSYKNEVWLNISKRFLSV